MSSTNSEGPWYQDGLKFSCSGCGDCCTGAPGFVWVNDDEVEAMAERINLSRDDFEDQYTRKIGARRSLKEFSNGDCVFFDHDSRKCEVYDLRPRQCRTWPFWDSNLKSPEAWAETCEDCPGSGQGKLFQIEEIEQRRRVMKI
jgi:Fe-S-cluster containining protein